MALLKRRSDKVEVLAGVPLFAGLSKRELGEIARHVGEVEIAPRDYLAYEGESGDRAFVILAGRVTVRRRGRKIAEMGAGSVVGEMSLITRQPRNATVRADTLVSALVMNSADLTAILDEHPRVAAKILRTVAERLAQADK